MDKLYLSNLEDVESVFPSKKTFEVIENYGQKNLQRQSERGVSEDRRN